MSAMSARVQAALLKNVHLDLNLQSQISHLDQETTHRLNDIRSSKNEIYAWQKSIKTKSTTFTLTSKKELQNMMANRNDYMTGRWTSFVDRVNVVRRRNRVLKTYNSEEPLAGQLRRIQAACKEHKIELFDIVRQINHSKAERARRTQGSILDYLEPHIVKVFL